MINATREYARRWLPPFVRKPLGSFSGMILHQVAFPLMGLVFDLTGGLAKLDNCVFLIPKEITTRGFRSCFLTKQYEVDERRLIPQFLNSSDSVLEVGACLGVVSCITNKLLQDPSRHLVVEANPYCLPAIYRNRELNNCQFSVESCAVSVARQVTFSLHPRFITGGSLQNSDGVAVKLPGRSFIELYDRNGPFSVLIMDIEGGELEVFETSGALLKKLRLIIVELHEWAIGKDGVARCQTILEDLGFKMAARSYITEVWLNTKAEKVETNTAH